MREYASVTYGGVRPPMYYCVCSINDLVCVGVLSYVLSFPSAVSGLPTLAYPLAAFKNKRSLL